MVQVRYQHALDDLYVSIYFPVDRMQGWQASHRSVTKLNNVALHGT